MNDYIWQQMQMMCKSETTILQVMQLEPTKRWWSSVQSRTRLAGKTIQKWSEELCMSFSPDPVVDLNSMFILKTDDIVANGK